ncbi:MAG: HEAT repeat domain-containing protein [Planctomycetota bacterium]|nr:HEAT repeat domain-containing protein [Planctomycetota bacterium]
MLRRVAGILLMAIGAGLASPAVADDEPERFDDSMYSVDFRVRVNDAIRKGVASLRTAQRPDGSFNLHGHYPMGGTALATLTLLKCGVKADDPQIVKAFAYMRGLEMRATYSVAVLLMALDAKYAADRDPFTEKDYDKYGNLVKRDPCARVISKDDKAWMREGVEWMTKHQRHDGVWRYPHSGYDISNTQFALLGLHAATRCGIAVDRDVWLDALEAILKVQEQTGEPVEFRANEVRGRYRFEWTERALTRGFRYHAGHRINGSMTSAGLTCLIICQNRLWRSRAFTGRLRVASRRGIRDAMAWLQHHFAAGHNPYGSNEWTWYYLYGLERCGILGRFRFLGTHDWYREGAEVILQKNAVSWRNYHACFALLFLKRATPRMNAPAITPSGGVGTEPATMPETAKPRWARKLDDVPEDKLAAIGYWVKKLKSNNPQLVFRATIKLGHLGNRLAARPLVATLRSHTDPYARVGAAVALGRLRACSAVEPLIAQLADPDDLVRHAVNQALIRITRHTQLVYLTAMSSDDRVRLRRAWRAWWAENEAAVRKTLRQPKRG